MRPTKTRPTMEHRHFVTVARILAMLNDGGDWTTLDEIIRHFADELAKTNENFDRARFLAAARGEPTGRDR